MNKAESERMRRWKLALGSEVGGFADTKLSAEDAAIASVLDALYGSGGPSETKGRGSLGASKPTVARWLGDIRTYFPASVVRVMQHDAVERLGLKQLLLEPELLGQVQPDIHLAATLLELKNVMPEQAKSTARLVIRKVVEELQRRLRDRTRQTLRGAINRASRTRRPAMRDVDWPRTIRANLRTYDPTLRSIVPEHLIGHARASRSLHDVILCLDQSGSMGTSVVYSGVFAAVMASLPSMTLKLVAFDTSVADLSGLASDPVELLFGVQLGGGTDIAPALAYCEGLVTRPMNTVLLLITDLFDGGKISHTLGRLKALKESGVNVVVLLALDDGGAPAFDSAAGAAVAALGIPAFACTPDQFPDMMAVALRKGNIGAWAAQQGIALLRAH